MILQLFFPNRTWMTLLIIIGGTWLISLLWTFILGHGLSLEREMRYDWAQVGDVLQERYTVYNDSFLPAIWLEVQDHSTIPDYQTGRVTSINAKYDPRPVQNTLAEVRTYIGVWMSENGAVPGLGYGENSGWEALTSTGLMPEAPRNTYIDGPNAARVVVGFKPDEKVHSDYGWIFNPETGQIWAAGFDTSDNPLPKAAPSAVQNASNGNNPAASPAAPASTTPANNQPGQSSANAEPSQGE